MSCWRLVRFFAYGSLASIVLIFVWLNTDTVGTIAFAVVAPIVALLLRPDTVYADCGEFGGADQLSPGGSDTGESGRELTFPDPRRTRDEAVPEAAEGKTRAGAGRFEPIVQTSF